MGRPKEAVQFDHLAGSVVTWRYTSKIPYGEGRKGKRWLLPSFKDKLEAALVELWVLSGHGPADRIVSAGAYTHRGNPTDRHQQARAIDIDAIHWMLCSVVTGKHAEYMDFYLGVEAHFRRHFHTVLGALYNKDHRGHWHIDDGQDLQGYTGSRMHTTFLQGVLRYVWKKPSTPYAPYYDGKIDGIVGEKTRNAYVALSKRLKVDSIIAEWDRFLLMTSIQGMRAQ